MWNSLEVCLNDKVMVEQKGRNFPFCSNFKAIWTAVVTIPSQERLLHEPIHPQENGVALGSCFWQCDTYHVHVTLGALSHFGPRPLMKLSARGSGHFGIAPPRHTLSENNRGRWAAERKTHILELKKCAHSILASPTRKLYTPIYTRVPVQGYSTEPCEGRGSWGREFWCYSLLILDAAWRCPSLLSADSHLWFQAVLLIHLHLTDIIYWPQTPVLSALPAP